MVDCFWNVMAHAQEPDFVFRRIGRVHLNGRGASVQSTTGSRGVRMGGGNTGYTVFRGSVKGTGYPLHSPVSTSLPLPCITVCHHISTGLYQLITQFMYLLNARLVSMPSVGPDICPGIVMPASPDKSPYLSCLIRVWIEPYFVVCSLQGLLRL